MKEKNTTIEKPPVVVIMGHIDHGKSTLLDYIRKTNVVDSEAGGITQHLSAYEVNHKDEKGVLKKITFLDTPGHEAFSQMRNRGASVADIAILIVSAEDSVKTQTVEALNTILDAKIPYIVAINKIDKPGANVEKVKMDLAEKGVYLEGYGGNIPSAEISAKVGTGIDHLLELILLVAEMGELKARTDMPAKGVVIESLLDTKRGISGTLLIKDGVLKKGMVVVSDSATVGTRIMEDFLGKSVSEAVPSSAVRLIGFDKLPTVGKEFTAFENKKDAEKAVIDWQNNAGKKSISENILGSKNVTGETKIVPIIIKTDVAGTIEAIEKEITKICTDQITCKIISKGVGAISEGDVKLASSDREAMIIGFNVKTDKNAKDLNENTGVPIHTFDVIYKITDWLREELEKRRPRKEVAEISGKAKILKFFSATKDRQVVGGRITEGRITVGNNVKIIRRDNEIGTAVIVGLEQGKIKTKEVLEGNECGILVESKLEIAAGDIFEAFTMVEK